MRGRIQPTLLVSEDEERGICSAADEHRRRPSSRTTCGGSCAEQRICNLARHEYKERCFATHVQLICIDLGQLRVVTCNRCEAEQIKGDKDEKTATGGVKLEEFGKVDESENPKNIVTDDIVVKEFGKVGKSENSKSIVIDAVKVEKLAKVTRPRAS